LIDIFFLQVGKFMEKNERKKFIRQKINNPMFN